MGAQLSTVSAVAVAGPGVAGICLRGRGWRGGGRGLLAPLAAGAAAGAAAGLWRPRCGAGGLGFFSFASRFLGFPVRPGGGLCSGRDQPRLASPRRRGRGESAARPGPLLPRLRRGWPCEGWSPHPAVAPPVPRPPAPSAASAMAAFVPPPAPLCFH